MSVAVPAGPTSDASAEDMEAYIWTSATHNYVSRSADLRGSQQVELRGRSVVEHGVVIRGDLSWVRLGRYAHVNTDSLIQPPALPHVAADAKYAPVTIGAHTWIGKGVKSEAAAIGSYCWIGDGAVLGARAMLKDACVIEDGVMVPPDTVVPPFTRISSHEGLLEIADLPPSITVELQERSRQYYDDFAAQQRAGTSS